MDGLGDGHKDQTFGFLFALVDFVDFRGVGGGGGVLTNEWIIITTKHSGRLDLHGPVEILSLGGKKRDPREHRL